MKAEVILTDRVIPVEIDARDRRAFEVVGRKQLGMPLSMSLAEAVKVMPESWVLWLAWHALRRNGQITQEFDTFNDEVMDVKAVEVGEDELPDPTISAP